MRFITARSATASLLALALALGGPLVAHADVFVIAHASVDLKPEDVRDVFVGEKQSASSGKLVPVDNAAAQAEFLSKVIKVDAAKYATLWSKKSFREGLNPPAVKGTDAEVVAIVKSTPGAVGYVTKDPGGVKVIQKY